MVPRETENNAYAKFWGTNKEDYGILWYFWRLSLDPTDLSPFGHLMKFTQRSFLLYVLWLSIAFYKLGLRTAFTD